VAEQVAQPATSQVFRLVGFLTLGAGPLPPRGGCFHVASLICGPTLMSQAHCDELLMNCAYLPECVEGGVLRSSTRDGISAYWQSTPREKYTREQYTFSSEDSLVCKDEGALGGLTDTLSGRERGY
jgi:hypothetical protein